MQEKVFSVINSGMNRDLSISKTGESSAFDNHNIRILARDKDTLLSVTNERGNKLVDSVELQGTTIGWNTLNNFIVVFTTEKIETDPDNNIDRIYRIEYKDGNFIQELLFEGVLGFSTEYPIESITYYETDNIQKIYWVDGKNVLRFMNFVEPKNSEGLYPWQKEDGSYDTTYFDSNRAASFNISVSISKDNSGNARPNGVVQYILTYFNKHGQETGSVWVSDIVYLSPSGVGGSQDGHNNNSVKLIFEGLDTSFTNFRVYSIFRSTDNGASSAFLVSEAKTRSGKVTVIDDYAHLTAIDPSSLLFLGSQYAVASTIESKDNTLFLGDLSSIGRKDYFDIESAIRRWMFCNEEGEQVPFDEESAYWAHSISFVYSNDADGHTENREDAMDIPYVDNNGNYPYSSQLDKTSSNILSFKGGEKYRFALKFKLRDGSETDAFWIGDKENTLYPIIDVKNNSIKRVIARCVLPKEVLDILNASDNEYASAQLMIADASDSDRSVKAQGIINPTMFNTWERYNNRLYSIPSWISRPRGSQFANKHFESVRKSTQSSGEIQCNYWKSDKIMNPYFQLQNGKVMEDVDGQSDFHSILITYSVYRNGSLWNAGYGCDFTIIKATPLTAEAETSYLNHTFEILDFSFWKQYPDSSDSDKAGWRYEDFPENAETPLYRLEYYKGTAFAKGSRKKAPDRTYEALIEKFNDLGLAEYAITSDTFTRMCNKESSVKRTVYFNPLGRYCAEHPYIDTVFTGPEAALNATVGESEPSSKRWQSKDDSTGVAESDGSMAYYKKHIMFVDENVVTLDSPEITYGHSSFDNADYKFRIIGVAKISSILSDYTIEASNSKFYGKNEEIVNFSGKRPIKNLIDGLTAWPLWRDYGLDLTDDAREQKKSEEERLPIDYKISSRIVRYWMYMWHKQGGILGYSDEENKQYSVLDRKVFANLRFSYSTIYMSNYLQKKLTYTPDFLRMADDINDTYRIVSIGSSENKEQKYYDGRPELYLGLPGVHKYPIAYSTSVSDSTDSTISSDGAYLYSSTGVILRYASQSHAILGLPTMRTNDGYYKQTILPSLNFDRDKAEDFRNLRSDEDGITGALIPWFDFNDPGREYPYIDYDVDQNNDAFTDNDIVRGRCDTLKADDENSDNYLFIGEIYKDFSEKDTRYGGTSTSDVVSNRFIVAGPQYPIRTYDSANEFVLIGNQGDTYFQRWDALRIKPYSSDSENNVIDITSAMLETHINLDGRTDLQRGIAELASINIESFGNLNEVYSQKNTFSVRRDLDEDYNIDSYRASITWTLPKTDLASTDEWSHITLSSTLKLDGDKGICRAIKRLGNSLISFQDRAISEVLFNSRTPLSTEAGVPVELANSGKVDGKRYITNKYGCINKWSITECKNALYFVDSINKAFCSYNGNVSNISAVKNFGTWFRKHTTTEPWTPEKPENIISFYDKIHSDIYLIRKDDEQPCLVYNELLDKFTSFFDYADIDMLANIDDRFVSLHNGSLWLQNEGLYCNFFGEQYPFWIHYRVAPDFITDKIWTNVEYRADFYRILDEEGSDIYPNDDILSEIDEEDYIEKETFDFIKIWNEYQDTGNFANMPFKKFRIWRCQIPRAASNDDNIHSFDRIRNPWVNMILKKTPYLDENRDLMQLHDVELKYYE